MGKITRAYRSQSLLRAFSSQERRSGFILLLRTFGLTRGLTLRLSLSYTPTTSISGSGETSYKESGNGVYCTQYIKPAHPHRAL